MNNNYLNEPPTANHEVPPKRQKMSMIHSSILSLSHNAPLSEWEWSGLNRELSSLHQFHKMRIQIEEIIEEEKEKLEIYMKVDTEIIKQFELALETSMWSPREDAEAEAFVRAEMSRIKSRMKEKLTNILADNFGTDDSSREDTSLVPTTQDIETEAEMELRAAEKTLEVELTHVSEKQWVFQEFHCAELEETTMEIQGLHSEKVDHAKELKEEVQAAEDSIPTLRETAMVNLVLENYVISFQKRSEDVDKVEELVISLPEKSDDLASSLQWNESRESETGGVSEGIETSPPSLTPIHSMQDEETADALELDFMGPLSKSCSKPTDNKYFAPEAQEAVSPPCPQSNNDDEDLGTKQSSSDLWIKVAKYYVQVSDPLYFQIDWPTRYRRQQDGNFICNECSLMKNGTIKMLDHIWVKHYGGRFKCPICSDLATTRHNIGIHIKTNHPDAFSFK